MLNQDRMFFLVRVSDDFVGIGKVQLLLFISSNQQVPILNQLAKNDLSLIHVWLS